MKRTSFLWAEDLAARTQRYAATNGLSVADVIRWALTEKMADHVVALESASNEELIAEVRRRQQPPNR